MKRYYVAETLGGQYCVIDRLSSSPWGKIFNISYKEAIEYCRYWNSKKISKWTIFWHGKEIDDLGIKSQKRPKTNMEGKT